MSSATRVFIAGGGPAGLTAGYLLSGSGHSVTVVDAHADHWGGISRTENYKGYRFDIGGHRFFSKAEEVERLWDEILPEPLLERPRKSRIFYRGKFYSYPLRPFEALTNLGLIEATRCVLSYARARLRPVPNPRSFEDWVSNAFGRRLFEIFFKTYTEKVWGMSCRNISADWAAQRIRGLSLAKAVWHAVSRRQPSSRAATVKTLIDTFRYPRLGPGMMWESAAKHIRDRGGDLRQGTGVTGLEWRPDAGEWTVGIERKGRQEFVPADHVVSSIALHELVPMLHPTVSDAAFQAAAALRYRDFLTVALIVRERERFDDNWIYVHEGAVRVGRIQNYKSWSPAMVPDPATACYGLEYFCNVGDDLWSRDDAALVELASSELVALKLADRQDILEGTVVRQPKAYPVYDADYARNVDVVRRELEARFPTLHLVGRNGMHKYNNQDHAMMTALIAAKNIDAGRRLMDPWRVNEDAEYHEEGERRSVTAGTAVRAVPMPVGGAG